jgi:hypothetical protein
LEIAQLQKGLVLMLDGEELIEEGVGFGAPVVLYDDRPYFSVSAECSVQSEGKRKFLVKSFVLDAVSRKRVGKAFYINDGFYKFFHERFHRTYVRRKRLTPFFNRLMELRRVFRVGTEFVKVKQRGIITVTYNCLPDVIEVEVSLSNLDRAGCREILILNEQGASVFRRYSDSDGLELVDGQVGAMETVEAEQACFSGGNEKVCFSLRQVKETQLFRGREVTRGRFSWAGFGYVLPPNLSVFKYTVGLKKPTQTVTSRSQA